MGPAATRRPWLTSTAAHGIEKLRCRCVRDALPRVNTNLTCIMIGSASLTDAAEA
jgi:hypothetical protein